MTVRNPWTTFCATAEDQFLHSTRTTYRRPCTVSSAYTSISALPRTFSTIFSTSAAKPASVSICATSFCNARQLAGVLDVIIVIPVGGRTLIGARLQGRRGAEAGADG